MTTNEALAELARVTQGVGKRVPSVAETAAGMVGPLRDLFFWQREKRGVYLKSVGFFLNQVRDIEELEVRANNVIERFRSMDQEAAGHVRAPDLKKAIGWNLSYVTEYLSAEIFLDGLGKFDALTESVKRDKTYTLNEYDQRSEALAGVIAYFREHAVVLQAPHPSELSQARAALIAAIEQRPFDSEKVLQRLEEMAKHASVESARQVKLRREADELKKKEDDERRRASEQNKSLNRDLEELKNWRSACRGEAKGQHVLEDTDKTLKEYESNSTSRGASELWPNRLRTLSGQWKQFADSQALERLKKIGLLMDFCSSANVGDRSKNLNEFLSLENKIGFERAADYESWREQLQAFDESLSNQAKDGGGQLRERLRGQVAPLSEKILELRKGPLLSAHRDELDRMDMEIDAVNNTRGEGFEDWQRSSSQLGQLIPQLAQIVRQVEGFRGEVKARRVSLQTTATDLAQAANIAGTESVVDPTALDRDLDSEPDLWHTTLDSQKAQLELENKRLADEFSREYSFLKSRARKMIKAGLPAAAFESAEMVPGSPVAAAENLSRLRTQVKSGEEACCHRLKLLVAELPNLRERVSALEAQDSGHQMETILVSIRGAIEAEIAAPHVPGAASIDAVDHLLELTTLRSRVENQEIKVDEDSRRVREKISQIGIHMDRLREEELADFSGALMPEHWRWIHSCLRGAIEAQELLANWTDAVEPQLDEAIKLLSSYDSQAQKVEGERFWSDMHALEDLKARPNLDVMKKGLVEKFRTRAALLPLAKLPSLEDRRQLRRLVR